jgi:hypothetical protein
LRGAEISGDLDCGGGLFRNPGKATLNCDGLRVGGDVYLRNGFTSEGEVRLLGAQIVMLDCSGGQFHNPCGNALNCDGLKATGGVVLGKPFNAEGAVRLLGASIDGNLDCIGAQFHNPSGEALNCDSIKVTRSVFLRDGFCANGVVRFVGAEIGGDLSMVGCRFSSKTTITAQGTTVKGELFWRDIENKGREVDAWLDLNHATVGPMGDDQPSWPESAI